MYINRKKLEAADKKYRKELSAINKVLARLMFNKGIIVNKAFYNNMMNKSKEHIESIFEYLSDLQYLKSFQQLCLTIEQKLKNYRSFIELHKKIADTWFNKHTQNKKG